MEAIRILYCHTLNDLNLIPVCLKSLHTLTGLVFIIGIIITHLEGIRIGKSKKVDFLLAVGGGSAIDTQSRMGWQNQRKMYGGCLTIRAWQEGVFRLPVY